MIGEFVGRYRFLSNFYPSPIRVSPFTDPREVREYPTVEHGFQALKAVEKADHDRVMRAPTPSAAKRLGRGLRPIRADWEAVRLSVMLALVRAKFQQHDRLAELLRATGSDELIEGNWWNDRFWGVCRGAGENHLGRILMRVREELTRG